MTQDDLAGATALSRTGVVRREAGQAVPTVDEVEAWCAACGMSEAEAAPLVELARGLNERNWVTPGLAPTFAALRTYERQAVKIVNVQPLIVPGLCQTAEYHRELMLGDGMTAEQADQWLADRAERREVLLGDNPAHLVAFIGEHAIRYPPCDDETANGQFRFLLEMSNWSNVDIRILPWQRKYTPALEGSFVVYHLPDGGVIVRHEGYRATTTLTDKRQATDYLKVVGALPELSLTPEDSRLFIAEGGTHK